MFFRNKKEINKNGESMQIKQINVDLSQKICSVDGDTKECDSVAKIRDYQQQLDNLKYDNIVVILDKYLKGNPNIIYTYSTLNILVGNGNIENFINDLTKYIKNEAIKVDLEKKIREEKENLGIR